MKRPSSFGESQQQGAGGIFVIGVDLYLVGGPTCFSNLLGPNVPLDHPTKGMTAEFVASLFQLSSNLLDTLQ